MPIQPGGGPTTVGHPHRSPLTGLVPEWAARDSSSSDGNFGDGRSIVDVSAEVSPYSPVLYVAAWVRPKGERAVHNVGGRPMRGAIAMAASEMFSLDEPGVRARAADWLIGLGITVMHATEVIEAAFARRNTRTGHAVGTSAETAAQIVERWRTQAANPE